VAAAAAINPRLENPPELLSADSASFLLPGVVIGHLFSFMSNFPEVGLEEIELSNIWVP
jgi:hypothetical protein